jgi:hypothetical protein
VRAVLACAVNSRGGVYWGVLLHSQAVGCAGVHGLHAGAAGGRTRAAAVTCKYSACSMCTCRVRELAQQATTAYSSAGFKGKTSLPQHMHLLHAVHHSHAPCTFSCQKP